MTVTNQVYKHLLTRPTGDEFTSRQIANAIGADISPVSAALYHLWSKDSINRYKNANGVIIYKIGGPTAKTCKDLIKKDKPAARVKTNGFDGIRKAIDNLVSELARVESKLNDLEQLQAQIKRLS